MMNKRISFLLMAALIFSFAILPAAEVQAKIVWPKNVSTDSQSAIVMVQETGTVLYEKNADEKHYPASITKILTALVALEHSTMDEKVTFSQKAVSQSAGGTSSIWRDVDEVMTMEECLYGMMLESANECAWAIGEHVGGGDIEVFLDMMNEKAKSLGCTNSNFRNPNGLPDEEHVTTARDMALIARAAYANPEFAKICGTKKYVIPPTNKHDDETYLNNHHCMLNFYKTSQYLYDYCVGGKTGYTVAAGSTLVTYAKKDGMTLIVVVMKSQKPAHWNDTRRLFDYYFDNYHLIKASEIADFSSSKPESSFGALGTTATSLIKVGDDDVVLLPKKAKKKDVVTTISPATPDMPDGAVGSMTFTYNDTEVGTATIYAVEAATKAYPFRNTTIETTDEEGTQVEKKPDFIRINVPLIIAFTVAAIVLIALLIFAIQRLAASISDRHRENKYSKDDRPKYRKIHRRKRTGRRPRK